MVQVEGLQRSRFYEVSPREQVVVEADHLYDIIIRQPLHELVIETLARVLPACDQPLPARAGSFRKVSLLPLSEIILLVNLVQKQYPFCREVYSAQNITLQLDLKADFAAQQVSELKLTIEVL